MPLFIHAMAGPFRMHGLAIQHARLADREVGHVDHLLYLAVTLGFDLADLQRYEAAQRVFFSPEGLANQPDHLAPLRRRHQAPLCERPLRICYHPLVVSRRCRSHPGDYVSRSRIHGLKPVCG